MYQYTNEDVAFERLKDLQREMENSRMGTRWRAWAPWSATWRPAPGALPAWPCAGRRDAARA
jgi:hypothetical protein